MLKPNLSHYLDAWLWRKSLSRLVAVAVSATLLSSCGGGSDKGLLLVAPAAPAAFTLQLLHVADADVNDTTALGSVAHMSGLVARFRADMPQTTLVVSSGDNYIPGPRFNASGDASLAPLLGTPDVGRADIDFLNTIGVQASALGNHELDLGPLQFNNIISSEGTGTAVWPGARFPYLAYNVNFALESTVAARVAPNGALAATLANRVSGWARVTYGAETIGIMGASSPARSEERRVGKEC